MAAYTTISEPQQSVQCQADSKDLQKSLQIHGAPYDGRMHLVLLVR